jgi:hypothetical protein
MEPRQDERKDREPHIGAKEAKPRRFRIVKMEERIAPGNGSGNGANAHSHHFTCRCPC